MGAVQDTGERVTVERGWKKRGWREDRIGAVAIAIANGDVVSRRAKL